LSMSRSCGSRLASESSWVASHINPKSSRNSTEVIFLCNPSYMHLSTSGFIISTSPFVIKGVRGETFVDMSRHNFTNSDM
jgi:hypothetical protein